MGEAPDNPQTVGQLSCQKRAGRPATADLSDSDITVERRLEKQTGLYKPMFKESLCFAV